MHWKTKANIQQMVSFLPHRYRERISDWLAPQREETMRDQPLHGVAFAVHIGQLINAQGQRLEGATCLEIGSGKRLNVAIALWVLGAKRIVAVDQHRQMNEKVVLNDIAYMQTHQDECRELLQYVDMDRERLDRLFHVALNRYDLERFIEQCGIQYLAPCDLTRLERSSQTVDFHLSHDHFQRLPSTTLLGVLKEGNRLIKESGLFIHRIDYSDRFARVDAALSPLNFLQYEDQEWDRYVGNQPLYMNRLRVDDIEELYQRCGHEIVKLESQVDPQILKQLAVNRISLNARFRGKPDTVLATLASWIVSCKRHEVSLHMVTEGQRGQDTQHAK